MQREANESKESKFCLSVWSKHGRSADFPARFSFSFRPLDTLAFLSAASRQLGWNSSRCTSASVTPRLAPPPSQFPGRGAKSLGADCGGRPGVPRKGVTTALAKEGDGVAQPTKRRRSSAGPRALNEPAGRAQGGERAARRKRHYGLRESPHQQTRQVPALGLGIQMSFRPALPNPARKSMKDFPRAGHAAPACSARRHLIARATVRSGPDVTPVGREPAR